MEKEKKLFLVIGLLILLFFFPKESGRYGYSMVEGLSGFSKECGCIGFEQKKVNSFEGMLVTEQPLVDLCWGIPTTACTCHQLKRDSTTTKLSIIPISCDKSVWSAITQKEWEEIKSRAN